MRAYNVAPQEGQAMKIVSGTLIVVLTLIGLIVAVPVILFGFAAIFGSGWGWILLLFLIGGGFTGYAEAAKKHRTQQAQKYQQQVMANKDRYLDILRERQGK